MSGICGNREGTLSFIQVRFLTFASYIFNVELRKWADSLLIAPLDANSLAKIANGICDNLLTSIVRAWDSQRPLYFAPAMNTYMWNNSLTYQHMKTVKEFLLYKVCLFHGLGNIFCFLFKINQDLGSIMLLHTFFSAFAKLKFMMLFVAPLSGNFISLFSNVLFLKFSYNQNF